MYTLAIRFFLLSTYLSKQIECIVCGSLGWTLWGLVALCSRPGSCSLVLGKQTGMVWLGISWRSLLRFRALAEQARGLWQGLRGFFLLSLRTGGHLVEQAEHIRRGLGGRFLNWTRFCYHLIQQIDSHRFRRIRQPLDRSCL